MYRYCSPIKKRCKRKSSRESASPECKNLNDKPFSVDKCRIAGNFNGYNVIVENKNDIIDLCKMGYGKNRYPRYHLNKTSITKITSLESLYKNSDENVQIAFCENKMIPHIDSVKLVYMEDVSSSVHSNMKDLQLPIITKTSSQDDVNCNNMNSVESINETASSDNYNNGSSIDTANSLHIKEDLHLMLEEAFFLSFGLNCLLIYNNEKCINHPDLWKEFQKVDSNFVKKYVAYHYFRAKGWVVKAGLQFGGDFLLYKQGPEFYHSSFIVIVISNMNEEHEKQDYSFFLSHYRIAEANKKELLICQVMVPPNFEEENIDHLKFCKVSEYIFKRWIPSENRELK